MSFTDKQRRSLAAKLKHRHVKTRFSQGGTLSYVEGWHVIAEANRIFGHDGWDRRTLSPQCVWSESKSEHTVAFYTTKVRIMVRAGEEMVLREGIGTGFGRAPSAESAHEIALKAAETDATKRALATFGNPFGLALYDKDQARVTRPPKQMAPKKPKARVFVLSDEKGLGVSFDTPATFADAVFASVQRTDTVDGLYDFWKRNRSVLEHLKVTVPQGPTLVEAIVAALKARARVLGRRNTNSVEEPSKGQGALAFPKEKRLRNKAHLQFVARQPCLICGRQPTHAHHVRFAQRRALGMKVSDEFTVPLCSVHHDAVHRTGNEKGWWVAQAIDPLIAAAKLWEVTKRGADDVGGGEPAVDSPGDGPSTNTTGAQAT